MTTHPVRLVAPRPERYAPIELLLRLLAMILVGILGHSFGLVFFVLFLGLPAFAAARLQNGQRNPLPERDVTRLVRSLHWLAAVYAWLGLVVDRLPKNDPSETVDFTVRATPTIDAPSGALWRILTGLPSLVVLLVLNIVGAVFWFFAAIMVLVTGQVPPGVHRFLLALQSFALQLLAYQATLVDELPTFSTAQTTSPRL